MSTNRVPAPDLIMAALAQATAPVTVTELAEEAGVGRSTVSKYLPTLEKDGVAVRTPGGRDGRRRLPDHWQAAPTTSPDENTPAHRSTAGATKDLTDPDTAPPTVPEAPVREQANPEPADAGEAETQDPDENPGPETEDPNTDQMPAPDPSTRTAPTAPDPASVPSAPVSVSGASVTPARGRAHTGTGVDEEGVNPVSGSRRLAPGELKTMVWALLKADPGAEFTATALSHVLQGRSIGAIQNNLAKLAQENKIELTCDKPRRYRFATSAN
ncbi:helix-turn-helix domain-containing protein [Nocardiopsis sp. NPDC055879]